MAEENVVLTPEAYRTLKELSDLAVKAANDPKTRKDFAAVIKKIDPSRRFPDIEVDEIRESVKKEFEDRDAARRKEETLARVEAQKSSLKSRYDDNAIGEIEKLMEKLGIGDYEVAARIYAAETKPASPSYEVNDHQWNMPSFGKGSDGKDIDIKDSAKLTQISRSKAYQVIDELKRARKAS